MKEQRERGVFVSSLIRIWKGINFVRVVVLNVVFFVLLFYVLSWWMRDTRPLVPDSTILVAAPYGPVVDQLKPRDLENRVARFLGLEGPETLQKDLLDAIEAGKDDERVKALFLDLDGLGGIGLTKLQDLGAAIDRFKATGKKVIAAADYYTRNNYYLAARADEIYLHHMGLVMLEGYGRYRRYYKEALDELEVDMHVFKVGTFKSAVEPYLRKNMSDYAKEANNRWLGVLWDSYLKDVAAARKIKVEAINDYLDRIEEHLKAAEGNAGEAAKKAGLVDHLASRDQVRKRLIELSGENKDTHSYYRIGYKSYLVARSEDRWGYGVSGDRIAVVVAKGPILDGYQPPGLIGGESTAKLLRRARQDEQVKAIVLQVDSGGGSAFASEVIRREMELAREEGKIVVVSMGSVAASGGYWISLAADEVWAYPTTITGSIGIFAMFPTFQETLAKYLHIYTDGVGTNKLAGALRTDRKLQPYIGESIQTMIDHDYRRFITTVAKARKSTPGKIDKIAQGRVWIGVDAHKLGLVDKLGTLSDALDSSAKLAKLGKDYNVKYFRQPPPRNETLLDFFLSAFDTKKTWETPELPGTSAGKAWNPYADTAANLLKQLYLFTQFNDPHGIYAYWAEEVNF
jgi:protease-4